MRFQRPAAGERALGRWVPRQAPGAAFALALAGLAQYQLAHGSVSVWQLLEYLVAGLLFAVSVPTGALPAGQAAPGASGERRWTFRSLQAPQWVGVAGVLGVNALCLALFWGNDARELAFYLWLGSLVAYILALAPLPARPTFKPAEDLPDRPYRLLFAFIVLAVAVVTLYQLGDLPYGVWFDEANFALFAQQILNGQADWPFITPFSDPALQMYAHAITQELFGSTPASTRLVAAVSGIVSVPLLGIFVSTVWNRTLALAAMVVLGFMRWHLVFSRIGMNEMVFVAFELAVAVALAKALTTRRPAWFAAAGVLTGLTMHIYLPSIAVTGMVILTLGYACLRRPRLEPLLVVTLLLGFGLAYAPLLEAGIQNPETYSGRAREVSIFSDKNMYPPLHALGHNLNAHVLMFNVQGDNNGRHNIPGQPQLDQVSAVLFVLGLAWACGRARRVVYLGLILWFLAMMLPGVLSLDFEAPQSARAVGAQAPLAILISLALVLLARTFAAIQRSARPAPALRLGVPAAAALVLATVAAGNVGAYFDAQAHNEAVWEGYSTDATFAGRELAQLPPREPAFLSPDLINTPSMLFLAPNRAPASDFVPASTLPLSGSAPAVFFLSRLDAAYLPLIREYYPHAEIKSLLGPAPGATPMAEEARLSTRDVEAITGLTLSSSVDPTRRRRITGPPGAFSGPAMAGAAVWSGGIQIPQYERAALTVRGPGAVSVAIDGRPACSGERLAVCRRTWVLGNHVLRVTVTSHASTTPGTLSFGWSGSGYVNFFTSPLMAHGLTASYFGNSAWQGPPVFSRVEPMLFYYYQYLDNLGPPWSARWSGQIHCARSGSYTFLLQSVDDSAVTIDGHTVATATNSVTHSALVPLTRGWHTFGAQLRAVTSRFNIYLSWIPPGSTSPSAVPVPASAFRP